VKVETGDIREKAPDEPFDIATLYNNIYYFPIEERVTLLDHIGSSFRPGGFLLLTTCCQGGSLAAGALNLWGAATCGAGRLAAEDELVSQLREAGYSTVKTKNPASRRSIRGLPGVSRLAWSDCARTPCRPSRNPATRARSHGLLPTPMCLPPTSRPLRNTISEIVYVDRRCQGR
jgi:hypothetical protein